MNKPRFFTVSIIAIIILITVAYSVYMQLQTDQSISEQMPTKEDEMTTVWGQTRENLEQAGLATSTESLSETELQDVWKASKLPEVTQPDLGQ